VAAVQHIRAKFGASQQQFAWLIGTSRETLRTRVSASGMAVW
jgi:DNA-binding transcriptional regulator YiaG